ncbi:ketol-acid reductoisomerase [Sphingomicrobium clamense]|uniref:Ketol-acid reductoisomerase n=1 Tax=Sphingomicrobium clamense TaxID=2851013 RepID=A0ABS6V6W6_9SPHN|nr:ketol-acid reductoisomerase [Sphingomicrobium sp. B8]MBW0145269.1 ketol-acid reductoisomerase [Sphingomicrobium sp. B8]
MDILKADQIDPAPLAGSKVAVIGYGNQGRAQAMNLRDSGIDVVVGLREDSASFERCKADNVPAASIADAATDAALVMMLLPDELMTAAYVEVEPHLGQGAALGFSHGLAIHSGFIVPRTDLDVLMVAPKGPGTALRSLYLEGKGMPALWAVAQDATGNAAATAHAYGLAIGCARAGLIHSSFQEECEADLFNEQGVVWGGVPALLLAGYDTLVEAGFSEEVAYYECVRELHLLAELIEARGIAGMREAISNTAELGAVLGGPKIVTPEVRQTLRDILASVQKGEFANALKQEEAEGYPLLRKAREDSRAHPSEGPRKRIESLE